MINEQLDEARCKEAFRLWDPNTDISLLAKIGARLAREGWTPPERVDPDLLAAREWLKINSNHKSAYIDVGAADTHPPIRAYLAGCTRGREGTKGLVEAAETLVGILENAWPALVGLAPVERLRAALASAKRGG